ncbi:hypothetical protein GCM10023200_35000 [Actinomycetospora chlora]|uniref:4Fe-4S Wbl-type domain-containing protein n=1 Tax=Actinomycetospora chlora TaxID=663608 RepID=A0ABP9BI18_9PSEU
MGSPPQTPRPVHTPEPVLSRLRRDVGPGREFHNPATVRLVLRRVLFDGDGPPSWREHATCDGLDDLFFPEPSDPDAIATCRAVCEFCPVQAACLDDVMSWERSGRRHGVVAGLTPAERTRLAREQRGEPDPGGAVA